MERTTNSSEDTGPHHSIGCDSHVMMQKDLCGLSEEEFETRTHAIFREQARIYRMNERAAKQKTWKICDLELEERPLEHGNASSHNFKMIRLGWSSWTGVLVLLGLLSDAVLACYSYLMRSSPICPASHLDVSRLTPVRSLYAAESVYRTMALLIDQPSSYTYSALCSRRSTPLTWAAWTVLQFLHGLQQAAALPETSAGAPVPHRPDRILSTFVVASLAVMVGLSLGYFIVGESSRASSDDGSTEDVLSPKLRFWVFTAWCGSFETFLISFFAQRGWIGNIKTLLASCFMVVLAPVIVLLIPQLVKESNCLLLIVTGGFLAAMYMGTTNQLDGMFGSICAWIQRTARSVFNLDAQHNTNTGIEMPTTPEENVQLETGTGTANGAFNHGTNRGVA